MSIGGRKVLDEFKGSPIALAEAFILGELKPYEEEYALESISLVSLEAARIRLESMGKLDSLSRRLEQIANTPK